jgi:hypothetical protein
LPEVSDNYQAIDVAASVVAVLYNALQSIAIVVLNLLNRTNSKTSIARNSNIYLQLSLCVGSQYRFVVGKINCISDTII